MNVTEALEMLSEVSKEAILLVSDPKDGLAVVVRWEDEKKRMAFLADDCGLEGNDLALHLVSRAADYLCRMAQADGAMGLAVRIKTVGLKVENAIDG